MSSTNKSAKYLQLLWLLWPFQLFSYIKNFYERFWEDQNHEGFVCVCCEINWKSTGSQHGTWVHAFAIYLHLTNIGT